MIARVLKYAQRWIHSGQEGASAMVFPRFYILLALANETHDLPANTYEKLEEKMHRARGK
jgi:hypothetical protein